MFNLETATTFSNALNGPWAIAFAVIGAALFASIASKYL